MPSVDARLVRVVTRDAKGSEQGLEFQGIVNLFALMQNQGAGAASHRSLPLGGQGRSRDSCQIGICCTSLVDTRDAANRCRRGRKCCAIGPQAERTAGVAGRLKTVACVALAGESVDGEFSARLFKIPMLAISTPEESRAWRLRSSSVCR